MSASFRPQRKVNPNANRYVPCRAVQLERSLSQGDQGFGSARHSLRIERAVLTSFSHCSKCAKTCDAVLVFNSSVVKLPCWASATDRNQSFE
jgi:hypothetical protein